MRRLVASVLLTLTVSAHAQSVSILHNAQIYSGEVAPEPAAAKDATPKYATAMAWRDGRVLALGDLDTLRADYPDAKQIDGGGAHVLPGLIDAHGHLFNLGYSLLNADLRNVDSKAEIVSRLQAFAAELPADAWLLGRGWDQNRWAEKSFPTAADLDAAFPDRPVWLERIDGHAGWASSAALRSLDAHTQAKLKDAEWQPDGGLIIREKGVPTGVFVDTASALVERAVPAASDALRERALRRALREVVRWGLTGVHDMGVSAADMAVMRRFADRQQLPLRITAYADGDSAALAGLCAFGAYHHASGRLQMRGVKLYADGALGSRGAALIEPYSDEPDQRGLLVTPPEALRSAMLKARDCGLQVAAHAIGDRGNRILLDLFTDVLNGHTDHRWRIEHAQVVELSDISRFAKLGIGASMQPTHATSDMPWAGVRVGADRLRGAYAWRRFLDSGADLPLGSDFPVEAVNPMLGLHAAITRQDSKSQPPGGWLPDQLLNRHEALRGFTLAAAKAGFAESEVGSLAPGKRADFVMLGANYFDVADPRVAELAVESTWVDGEVVYRRGEE
ncbi:MAG: amidohydrolase [Pseudomarimonas sp.]